MGAKPAKRPFNARRWQMAATHVKEQQPYILARTACSRIRKKARLAFFFFLSTYYSAAVARRYLKSGMSNSDVARRRRQEDMSRASLTAGGFIVIRGDAKTSSSYLQFVPLDSLLSALFRFDSRSQRGRFRSVTVSRG